MTGKQTTSTQNQLDLENQLDLDRYVPSLVNFLANKLSSGASACYRKYFNIGVVEWRLMALLKVEENITANRMSQVIGLDKSVVSRALKLLMKQNYVTFTPDEKDGRSLRVNLTPSGIKLHDRILKVALEREALLLGDLKPEELDVLVALLQKLSSRVGVVNSFEPEVL